MAASRAEYPCTPTPQEARAAAAPRSSCSAACTPGEALHGAPSLGHDEPAEEPARRLRAGVRFELCRPPLHRPRGVEHFGHHVAHEAVLDHEVALQVVLYLGAQRKERVLGALAHPPVLVAEKANELVVEARGPQSAGQAGRGGAHEPGLVPEGFGQDLLALWVPDVGEAPYGRRAHVRVRVRGGPD